MARKIIGIKVCYYLIKIFLHNKIHFKINSIIYCIRVYRISGNFRVKKFSCVKFSWCLIFVVWAIHEN